MLQNTQAFILKINPKGETSAVVHCFTRDFGKLILIAKGARTSKSPLKGILEPFSLLNIHFNEKKGRAYQFLAQAENVLPFTHLKGQADGILYGSILLEILYKEQEDQQNRALFDMIHAVFSAIDAGAPAMQAHWYFILRYLKLEGLPLDTADCYVCGAKLQKAYFIPRRGHICCSDCSADQLPSWELDDTVMTILREMPAAEPGICGKESMDKERATLINRVLWNALATRFENCKTLRSVTILRKVL